MSVQKTRKDMQKRDMKAITGVSPVNIKKSNTYIIFREATIKDLSNQLQTQTVEQFKALGMRGVTPKGETGLDKKGIELVVTQASMPRSRVVKALKAADGDIVSAIMELTN